MKAGWAWVVGTLYAASDEIHQLFVPGRSGQLRDVLLDSAGVAAGILLAWMITYDPADVTWHSLVAFAAALAYVAYKVGQRLWRAIRRPQEVAKKRN